MPAAHPQRSRADQEAADWFARLNTLSISTRSLEEFQAWRRNPENDAAYERIEGLWASTGELANDTDIRREVRAALARGPRRSRPWTPGILRARVGYGLAALAAAIVLVVIWANRPAGETYATGLGEQRLVSLADGSRVRLDTDTEVMVRLKDAERRIELVRGQAFFDVAHDPQRPFLVRAHDTEVRALGTRFDVRREGQAVAVTLVEGSVEVTGTGNRAWRLAPGQRLEAQDGQAAGPQAVDLDAATSWTDGRLIFRARPLSQAVAEVNRYSRRKVVVEAAHLQSVPISGVFDVGDTQAFVAAVSNLFELEPDSGEGEIRLRPRRS